MDGPSGDDVVVDCADPIGDLAARCAFPDAVDGESLSLAVSGGADSLALMILARHLGLAVTAIHVDHGLRPGSAVEADVVRLAADRFGAGFRSLSVAVEPGPNLESRARDARYGALPPDVLTGHTADDQAETILMFLMRGVGPAGLAGIDPATRPLLGLRRTDTEEVCRRVGVEPVDDPSNRDPRFRRNRVRRELIPLMNDIAERDVVPLVARAASLLRDQRGIVDVAVTGIEPTDAAKLAALPPALAREVLRRWYLETTESPYGPDASALDRMVDVASGVTRATDCGGGWRLDRSGGTLRLVHAMVGDDGIR